MCADAEYCPIIPQGEHGEGVGGERGAGGGHTVVSLSPPRHHCLPRHLNKGKKGYVHTCTSQIYDLCWTGTCAKLSSPSPKSQSPKSQSQDPKDLG